MKEQAQSAWSVPIVPVCQRKGHRIKSPWKGREESKDAGAMLSASFHVHIASSLRSLIHSSLTPTLCLLSYRFVVSCVIELATLYCVGVSSSSTGLQAP